MISNGINVWYNEHQFASQSDINLLQGSTVGGNVIGHFTVMVSERNIAVGCGMSQFFENGRNVSILACNYAAQNTRDRIVYRTGPIGSGCTLGRDTRFTGLCRTNEPINPNSFD